MKKASTVFVTLCVLLFQNTAAAYLSPRNSRVSTRTSRRPELKTNAPTKKTSLKRDRAATKEAETLADDTEAHLPPISPLQTAKKTTLPAPRKVRKTAGPRKPPSPIHVPKHFTFSQEHIIASEYRQQVKALKSIAEALDRQQQ